MVRIRLRRSFSGFTLIELLVVIAIIGLLSSIVLASVNSARAKARDAKRVADLNQIRTALELYYADYGKYPDNTDNGDVGCWSNWDGGSVLNGASDPFIQPLVTGGYMPRTPREASPTGSSGWEQCSYRYMRATNPCGCAGTYGVVYSVCETTSFCPRNERPSCCTSWGEGAGGWDARDYVIFLKE
ncbi:MAG: hypothetical protein KatS3mg099_426 [Candidatus Parcubacteria bacterium]|nr:MAG: hypothetical protein KatS3mg099_426 [Candidatus Parcubacteria bacterium]